MAKTRKKTKVVPVAPFSGVDPTSYEGMMTGLIGVHVDVPGGVQILPPTPMVNHGGLIGPDDNNSYDIRGRKKPGK